RLGTSKTFLAYYCKKAGRSVRFHDLVIDTLHTLWVHKLRTFLTMFGIVWGIVSIVLMVAAGEGLREGQANVANSFGKAGMVVFGGPPSTQAGGARAGRRIRFEDTDLPRIQDESPDCKYVLPELGQGGVRVHSDLNAGAFTVTGSTPAFSEVRTIEV